MTIFILFVSLLCLQPAACTKSNYVFAYTNNFFLIFIYRDVQLQSSCVCNASQNEGFNAISIQCQAVNFPKLMLALRTYTSDTIIENLYVSNTTVASLTDFVFKNLKIISLHLTGKIRSTNSNKK